MPLQLVASFGIKVGDKKRKREGKALSVIRFGIMTFTSYGDAEVKRGVGKILKAPLYTVLGEEITECLRPGYELNNHPKANGAIKLINLSKAAKQRILEGIGDMDDVYMSPYEFKRTNN